MATKIIGHRGASGLVEYDSSVKSFEKAIELGVDMVEFDVRRTKDGTLTAFHDSELDGEDIEDITHDEIQEITGDKGYKVPTVEDVVRLCKGKIDLDIELKVEGYEEEVIELVLSHLDHDGFIIKSFSDETVKSIKEYDPKIEAGLILGNLLLSIEDRENNVKTRISELFPKRRLRRCNADFVAPYYRLLKFFFIRRMENMGMDIYVWTVNDVEMMKSLMKKGVEGIITDRPDLALELREGQK